jgi:hypothetical protein
MSSRIATLLLFVCLLPGTVSASDYRDGLDALERHAYATARISFLKSAQRGHAASQSALGILALDASDRAANHAEALGWLLAAQENGAGDLDAYLAKAREGGAQSADEPARKILATYGRAAVRKHWIPDFTDQEFNPCKPPGEGRDPHEVTSRQVGMWQHAAVVLIEHSRTGRFADIHSVFRLPAGTKGVTEEIFLKDVRKQELLSPTPPTECPMAHTLVVRAGGPKSNMNEILQSAERGAEIGDPEALYTIGMALWVSNQSGSFDLIKTAAQAGHPDAQYYLSKQLPNRALAHKWLELAAEGGVPAARIELAEALLASNERSSHLPRVRTLLEQAATGRDDYVIARIAAIRAAAPDEQLRDAQFALNAARGLDLKTWPLPIRLEAAALSHAAAGDFKAAIRFQERAIGASKRMGHDTAHMKERLDAFVANKMWFGYLATEYR